MKFSVAPESSKVEALALLLNMCRNTYIDIDWQFDKYTQSELTDLIKAALIRPTENPTLYPGSFVPEAPSSHLGGISAMALATLVTLFS